MANKKHHISSYQLAEHLNESLDLLKHELNALGGNPDRIELAEIERNIVQELQSLRHESELLTQQPIRTIHHLSCTGGTLIAKCIAALPNVQLLSEIDPLSTLQDKSKPMFGPTDLIKQWRQSSRGASNDDIIELFLTDMKVILKAATRAGQNVVIRDHSHSHFNSGPEIPERPTIRRILQRAFDVKSLVTVRHPADSYVSMVKNGWHTHFQPSDFKEYCDRYFFFLENYSDVYLIKYENFVKSPSDIMRKVANELALDYADTYLSTFSAIKLTGDSGRTQTTIIEHEPRKEAITLREENAELVVYKELCSKLSYDLV
ncbi:MAG: hypothetical protein LAT77_10650 [Aliidiomarina sp.]|uniref:hypothetical protein n=1 Tax=Aliidiomarina sp. TaxID=1872439 RepID=UPI0025C72493|nr:hypothetical protein [Aliidiomarina sp.]MCH8502354.1 hypothetical protein [Aliidiomarina sp.]